MSDDTGTDWAAEAEWHERQACPAGLPWTGDDPSSDHGHTDCLHHHTAAVGLRRLAQLDTAARDLMDEIDPDTGLTDYKALERFAAVLGSGEQPAPPTTCPTCGSDTPMVCHIGLVRPHHHGIIGDGSCCCPDSWHWEQR